MTRVALVSCCGPKLQHPAPARELYTSALFRYSREWSELSCDRWLILSAKYGLVEPDRVLAPYDLSIVGAERSRVRLWSLWVAKQLVEAVGSSATLVLLAGSAYGGFREHVPNMVEEPLAGLTIGRRLQWFKAERGREART